MTTETLTQEQAQELWNQLDAQDAGHGPAPEAGAEDPVQAEAQGNEGAAQAAPESAAADPYEGLQPHVKDELIGLKALVTQLSGRLRNAEGHIGGLKSALQTQVEAAKEVRAAGGAAPSANEIREAQGNPAAFEQLKQDYPEFAAAIDSFVSAKLDARQAPAPSITREELDRLRTTELSALKEQIEREVRVEVRHPGWKKTVVNPDFIGWHAQQPPEVRNLSASPDPDDAIRLLDLYAEARKPRDQNQSLRAAAALPSGRSHGTRVKPVEEMTPQEFWKHLDELDRQQARR